MNDRKKTIKIKQIGSPIRRSRRQGLYLKSLGLRHIGSVRTLKANESVLALMKKVRHMIQVVSEGE